MVALRTCSVLHHDVWINQANAAFVDGIVTRRHRIATRRVHRKSTWSDDQKRLVWRWRAGPRCAGQHHEGKDRKARNHRLDIDDVAASRIVLQPRRTLAGCGSSGWVQEGGRRRRGAVTART